MDLGNMIAFTTITETIFAWPGMGKLLIDAINKSDRPIIVAYLMTGCLYVRGAELCGGSSLYVG